MNLDKIRGFLIGVFLGDALGAPHEFRKQKDVYTGKLQYPAKMHNRQGVKHFVIGQVTDDSEMTLIILRGILRDSGYNMDNLTLDYIEWANSKPGGIGINTAYLFKGITAKDPQRRLNTYKNRYSAKKEIMHYNKLDKRGFGWDMNNWTQSNGSLMRCSPLVLLKDSDIIIKDCQITNPHPVNIQINQLYLKLLNNAILNVKPIENFNQIIIYVNQEFSSYQQSILQVLSEISNDYLKYLETGQLNLSRNVQINKGWVLHSFYVAIMAYILFGPYKDLNKPEGFRLGLDWIISLKGDTDTNAAIGGALLGSYYGWDLITKDNLTKENIDILLAADPNLGDYPRDKKYKVNDFMEFTTGLFNHINK